MAELQKEILRISIEKGSISIAEYSRLLGTSIPTATKVIMDMISEGLLQDEGKVDTKGGRRPNVYGLNPRAGYFVGVDIARHHFHIAICDFKGEMVKFVQDIEFVLEANADSFKKVCRRIKDEVAAAGISWESVRACGVSLTGRVNPEKGYSLTYFVNDELPIKDQFEQQLGVPVNIENDSRAMAFGEYMTLGEKADKNMVFVNVGWGLGMGLILDGRLYYGKSGFSGEIGHFPYLDNDIICRCGKIGCLETGASGWALHRIILQKISEGKNSPLAEIYKNTGRIELKDILDAMSHEDILAIEGMESVGNTLGKALAGVINIFNPGLVVIGGRLIVGGDYLMLPIKSAVNKHSLTKVAADTKFRFSTLDRKAASVGDCLLARSKYLGF